MWPDLTVSIVTYDDPPEVLRQALESLLASSLKLKIFIVCNGKPFFLPDLAYREKGIEIIRSLQNLGYGKGNNLVLRALLREKSPPFHLVMNPDVFFSQPVLEELWEFMQRNSEVGLVMPKVLYPDGRLQYLCRLLPTPLELLVRRFAFFKRWRERIRYLYELRFTGYRKIMEVPFLSGCFMFLRMEALKKVGFFDERYFLYFEDVDLCRRLWKYYRNIFYPDVHIYHLHKGGSHHDLRLAAIHFHSGILYFNKWGWWRDAERKKINEQVLKKLGL